MTHFAGIGSRATSAHQFIVAPKRAIHENNVAALKLGQQFRTDSRKGRSKQYPLGWSFRIRRHFVNHEADDRLFRKQNGLALRSDICGIFAGQSDRMTSETMPGSASGKFKRRGRVNVMPFDLLGDPLQELEDAVVLGQDATNSCSRVQMQRLKFGSRRSPRTWSRSPPVSTTPAMGVCGDSVLGCKSDVDSIWLRRSAEAPSKYHVPV